MQTVDNHLLMTSYDTSDPARFLWEIVYFADAVSLILIYSGLRDFHLWIEIYFHSSLIVVNQHKTQS